MMKVIFYKREMIELGIEKSLMHELSIVMSIVETAEEKVKENHAHTVESIDLVIGDLAGVDSQALDFAWEKAVKNTVLQAAKRNIIHVPARAKCMECDCEFEISELHAECPLCGEHLLQIVQGKEIQIKSMVLN
jgi:hydrogenase nickel incorporation protein HypA/HybF